MHMGDETETIEIDVDAVNRFEQLIVALVTSGEDLEDVFWELDRAYNPLDRALAYDDPYEPVTTSWERA